MGWRLSLIGVVVVGCSLSREPAPVSPSDAAVIPRAFDAGSTPGDAGGVDATQRPDAAQPDASSVPVDAGSPPVEPTPIAELGTSGPAGAPLETPLR